MKQWIINLIIILLSIIAILFSLLRVTPFEITSEAYIGTIVSLLSLATAFAIGYQIYNAIELKKEIENQRKKYYDIIRRNEEIENKLKSQEYTMQEGFDIISSLIAYNSKQSDFVCGIAFQDMHRALLSSIETNRTDYEMIFGYLRKFISDKGKILPRRATGACAKHQRTITLAVKRARHIAVLPFTQN